MPITAKGKRWEILHSLWIGWTFTLGFFNWIAFLYIGFRSRQRKWILWGLLYAVPFIIMMFIVDTGVRSTLGNLAITLQLIIAVVSPIHAFKVRKEYLMRLEALEREASEKEAALKQQLGPEKDRIEVAPEQNATTSRKADQATKPTDSASDSTVARHRRASHPSPSVAPKSPTVEPKHPVNQTTTIPSGVGYVSRTLQSQDELDYQISSSYPFPIAFGFRSLMSIVDTRDLYREQLRIAENILAFLASVSLALVRKEDRERAEIVPAEYWRGGISPGDWKDIVGRCSKIFATCQDNPLALAINGLNIRSEKMGFGKEIAALIKAKNDYKHDRGPVVLEDIADASKETQEKLKRCMKELAFTINYPIRQVEDFNVSRSGEKFFLKCLRYTGDHPSFPQEEVVFDRGLRRGDLFLDLGNQSWVSMYPFIVTRNCPHCKVKETYFIDMWDQRRKTARMKSFERGHGISNSEVSGALAEW